MSNLPPVGPEPGATGATQGPPVAPAEDSPTPHARAREAAYPWRERLIDALWTRGGDLDLAAQAVGVSLGQVFCALEEEPVFAREVERVRTKLAARAGELELRAADGELFTAEEIQRRPWLLAFVVALREEWGNVSAAARRVGISRTHAHAVRKELDSLDRAWRDAVEETTDAVEANGLRWAAEGTWENVYHQGRVVGRRQIIYPALTMGLLKARRREVYGAQQLELFADEDGEGGIHILLPKQPAKEAV